MSKRGKWILSGILVIGAGSLLLALGQVNWSMKGLFVTPDQQGRRLMAKKEYQKAASVFEDPMQRGTALYRAGDFKNAAAAFGQDDSAEALYNRANALLMTGGYDQAIAGYREALNKKPGWKDAADNLELAIQRQKLLHPPDEGDTGTGGYLPPDKIVFDNKAANQSEDQKQTVDGGQQRLTNAELNAMWLRQVQTQPADFLRAKFSYQAAQQSANDPKQQVKQ